MPRLDMIGVVCKDIAASIAFYRSLGVDLPEQPDGPYVEANLPGGMRLSLNDVEMMKGIDADWQEPKGHAISLAFLCDDAADVDATYARLIADGAHAHKEPWDAFWGQRYAQILDPDGNVTDLFAPL